MSNVGVSTSHESSYAWWSLEPFLGQFVYVFKWEILPNYLSSGELECIPQLGVYLVSCARPLNCILIIADLSYAHHAIQLELFHLMYYLHMCIYMYILVGKAQD